jgi:hypothetical protein
LSGFPGEGKTAAIYCTLFYTIPNSPYLLSRLTLCTLISKTTLLPLPLTVGGARTSTAERRKIMHKWKLILLISLLFLVSGCTALTAQRVPLSLERPQECQALLSALDESVEQAGVRDAASYQVPGFPYLRTNRFLSRLKDSTSSEQEKMHWVGWMQKLDLESRKKEVCNLPKESAGGLLSGQGPEKLYERVKLCSDELLRHDTARANFYETLIPLLNVPDEYSFTMRAIGFYPLMAIPVAIVTDSSRENILSWYHTDLENLPVDGRLTAFIPAESSSPAQNEIQAIMDASRATPLGVPVLDEMSGKKLVERFAPVFIQDVAAAYDQLGRIVWGGNCPDVDPSRPTVYYYFSNAFFKGKPVLQINYVIWYSARAGKRAPRIEQGHLDGLTLRVSLDEAGKPFMVDLVNDCGCYHLFAPDRDRVERTITKPFMFDPFIPQWLPHVAEGERLGVRLNSGWHQVQRLITAKDFPDPIPYELVPYDILEILRHEDGRTESIFDSGGIAKCAERIERFILFSMGIPMIGSMRQRGHHAIELIGRAHFDDPDLFDRSFVFR